MPSAFSVKPWDRGVTGTRKYKLHPWKARSERDFGLHGTGRTSARLNTINMVRNKKLYSTGNITHCALRVARDSTKRNMKQKHNFPNVNLRNPNVNDVWWSLQSQEDSWKQHRTILSYLSLFHFNKTLHPFLKRNKILREFPINQLLLIYQSTFQSESIDPTARFRESRKKRTRSNGIALGLIRIA